MVVILNSNQPTPTEGLHHVEPNVTAYSQHNPLGKGTLYIAESTVCWIASSGEGFCLRYQDINAHAISKDRNNFPDECLYLIISGNINLNPAEEEQEMAGALNNLSVEDEESDHIDDEDDFDPSSEMYFVPDNLSMLHIMYRALSDCQALNPDPEDPSDEDGDDDAVIGLPFTDHVANGSVDDYYGAGGDQEEEMDNDQFEDAEQ